MSKSIDTGSVFLSPEWKRELKRVTLRYPAASATPRIAVFDLDNTLLINDIGDAVFADLRARSLKGDLREIHSPLPLSWSKYSRLIKNGRKEEAYRRVAQSLAGLEIRTIRDATLRVMSTNKDFVRVEGFEVPAPWPDPGMKALLKQLKRMDFRIFIISASNQVSVRMVAREFLGLDPEDTWGIRSSIRTGAGGVPTLTGEIIEPFPYGSGKADLYRLYLGEDPPLVSAGDSESDIPLLNLTLQDGWIIWCGEVEVLNRDPSPFLTPEIVTTVPWESRLDITSQE